MQFSALFRPTTLFSLKDSNSTNSGAKSLLLPSPYAIKMAIINQAIVSENNIKQFNQNNSLEFKYVKDTNITYKINGNFCINNSFLRILKPSRSNKGYQSTVSFREYIHVTDDIEIIFNISNYEAKKFLMKYIHKISYFGKKGCFFQFIDYNNPPNKPNVIEFDPNKSQQSGILQEFDDFPENSNFEKINNYSSAKVKRKKVIFLIPVTNISSSKSYTHYKCI